MSEVEKMYRTIFGEFTSNCSLCAKLINCEIINNTHNCNKFECDYKRLFTAEKQLELIKKVSPSYPLNYHIKCFQGYTFEEGLALCVNNLWQFLTEEEHTQIKEILSE